MTTENGGPSPDRVRHSDRDRKDGDETGAAIAASSGGASRAENGDALFSLDARMAHELVSLFLAIDDQDTRERCLAFVREQAAGSAD